MHHGIQNLAIFRSPAVKQFNGMEHLILNIPNSNQSNVMADVNTVTEETVNKKALVEELVEALGNLYPTYIFIRVSTYICINGGEYLHCGRVVLPCVCAGGM